MRPKGRVVGAERGGLSTLGLEGTKESFTAIGDRDARAGVLGLLGLDHLAQPFFRLRARQSLLAPSLSDQSDLAVWAALAVKPAAVPPLLPSGVDFCVEGPGAVAARS